MLYLIFRFVKMAQRADQIPRSSRGMTKSGCAVNFYFSLGR